MSERVDSNRNADFIIVGGGIIGLSIARELKNRHPEIKILLLEKEPELGRHASGRNSGVLHSGLYYPEETLKARLCSDGAKEMANYCKEYNLPFNPVGKVILPVRKEDDSTLEMLYRRGVSNGARLSMIDEKELKVLEPSAFSITGKAIYSPDTAVMDPVAILHHIADDLRSRGVEILFNREVKGIDTKRSRVVTEKESFSFGYLINAAGLHADRIAKLCQVGEQFSILPFKGLYWRLDESSKLPVNGHIYPVPDLKMPFLGVHFTKSVTGKVYLGPTALPALGRENYKLLQDLDLLESPLILARLLRQYLFNRQGFRCYANAEVPRYIKIYFAQAAKSLVPALKAEHLVPCDKVGIRAQLIDLKTGSMVTDFRLEWGDNSMHILNAVSPAFTSAFTFSRFVLEQCL